MPFIDVLFLSKRKQSTKPAASNDQSISTKETAKKTLDDLTAAFLENSAGLKKMLSNHLHSPHQIEDILQESYVRTMEANKKVNIRSPKAFLYKVAHNLSLNHKASSYQKYTDLIEDFESLGVLSTDISVEDTVEQSQNFLQFCNALGTLPKQCRKVFVLSKVYGLSHMEIANTLGISVSTVEKHLAKGLLSCRDYLLQNGYTPGN